MSVRPDTAMILSAGLGTRMRPLTQTTAKPLLKVADKALMDYLIEALIEAGIRRLVANVHWCADQVEAHLARFSGIELIISDEREQLLETGGGLAKARPFLGQVPIFVVNTDAFWGRADTQPLHRLMQAFDPENMDELLLLADTGRSLGYCGAGDFFLGEQAGLSRRGAAPSAPYAYAGVRMIKPQLYDNLPAEPFSANQVWTRLIAEDRLRGVVLDDFWLHVGDPEALKDAEMWMRCHGA